MEDAAKAKKADFVASLQAGLNEGGGYRKTPLVVEDFDEEQQEMLRGLEVRRWVQSNVTMTDLTVAPACSCPVPFRIRKHNMHACIGYGNRRFFWLGVSYKRLAIATFL